MESVFNLVSTLRVHGGLKQESIVVLCRVLGIPPH
jgi:hypothetical protein